MNAQQDCPSRVRCRQVPGTCLLFEEQGLHAGVVYDRHHLACLICHYRKNREMYLCLSEEQIAFS